MSSSATPPQAHSARWYPETFGDRYLNTSTRHLVSSRYVWKGLSTDFTAWAKACLDCQWAKVHCHVEVPQQHIPVPTRLCSHIHVNLVGPLPASKSYSHLFTIMDRTSRWPEAIPIASTVDCANALSQVWVSRFGVPAGVPNGMAQHFHCRLKDMLRTRCAPVNWVDHIPWLLLGLCAAAREGDGTAPCSGSVRLTTHFTW